jgi:hypothetical protein
MTACPSCGSPVEAADRFCGACGTTLEAEPAEVPAPRFCTRCGGPLDDEDRFCGRCGAPARADAAAQPEEDEEDFFADWNLVFAEEPSPGPQEAVTEAVPRPPTAGVSDTSVLPIAPRAEAETKPERPPPPPRRHPPPRGFPWGATVALAGAVAVVVSAILPWTGEGALPKEIPARSLIADGAGGVNLGFILLVAGTIGALVALLTMLLPWLGFLRRLAGILTLAIPVLFVLRALDPPAGLGDLIEVLGAGVYAAGAGAIAQVVAGKWRT